jgi:hypothetical protein
MIKNILIVECPTKSTGAGWEQNITGELVEVHIYIIEERTL